MFNLSDLSRDALQLNGAFSDNGYDWWWHSFTAHNVKTGEERQFFIEYFLVNPALGQKYPVYGQSEFSKERGIKPSYLMVKAGCWGKDHKQLHRFFGWKEIDYSSHAPFRVQAGSCYIDDFRIMGHVNVTKEDAENHPEYMSDAGSMYWDLKVNKKVSFNVGYGAGSLFRELKAFEMYWHAEGMKSTFDGEIVIDGQHFVADPETSFGYADKNWGSGFTEPWLWLSSNSLYSEYYGRKLKNSVFDIGGGRPKAFGVDLGKKLLGAFYYEGEEYEYNFSKPWTHTFTKFKVDTKGDYITWKVWQENSYSVMKTTVKCKKSDMIFVKYEDPQGHAGCAKLWNGGNGKGIIRLYSKTDKGLVLMDKIHADRVGCEWSEY